MHFSPKLLRDKIRGNEFWAKLAKNVSTIVLGQGGASAFNMLTSFVSAGFLGVAGYGSLMIGQTYMQAIDALLNFQSWQSVIRYGSICLEKRDERGLAASIKAAFLVDVISAVAGCIISFAIVGLVAGFLGWDSAATAAAVVFSFEILAHIEGAPTGLLRLFDKFNYVAIHAVVMAAVKLLLVGASMVLFGNNVIVIACAYCAADVIKSLTLFLLLCMLLAGVLGLLRLLKHDASICRLATSPLRFGQTWKPQLTLQLCISMCSSSLSCRVRLSVSLNSLGSCFPFSPSFRDLCNRRLCRNLLS